MNMRKMLRKIEIQPTCQNHSFKATTSSPITVAVLMAVNMPYNLYQRATPASAYYPSAPVVATPMTSAGPNFPVAHAVAGRRDTNSSEVKSLGPSQAISGKPKEGLSTCTIRRLFERANALTTCRIG